MSGQEPQEPQGHEPAEAEPPSEADPAVVVEDPPAEAAPDEADADDSATGATLAPDQVADLLGDLRDQLAASQEGIEASLEQLMQRFESRLAYDTFKETQLDRMHAELQEYKKGLAQTIARPLLLALVQLHDDVARSVSKHDLAEPVDPRKVVEDMKDLLDDIEIILSHHAVETFEVHADAIDVRRHKVVKVLPAPSPELAHTVAEHTRAGFERDGEVLRKQHIVAYGAWTEATTPPNVDPDGASQ